jgi:hypothetical protein
MRQENDRLVMVMVTVIAMGCDLHAAVVAEVVDLEALLHHFDGEKLGGSGGADACAAAQRDKTTAEA